MVDITDSDGWVSVTRPEATDLALGGNEVNFPGRYYRELASRDRWIRDQLESLFGLGDATAQATTAEFTQVGVAAISQGRLSLVTADPVGQATGASTLFFIPYNGDYIALYNTTDTRWELRQFTQRTLDISALAANTNYDIFAYWAGSTVELQAVPWASSGYGTSTRSTGLTRQNGIWVNSSNSRRYIGTIRMTAVAGQCETSATNQFVWNAANRVSREMYVTDATSYSYGAAAWRFANLSTTSARVNFICGLDNEFVSNVVCRLGLATNARGVQVAIGQNDTTPLVPVGAQYTQADSAGAIQISRNVSVSAGAHFFNTLEFADFVSTIRNPAVLMETSF